MTDRKLRRNDIVRKASDGWFYGRVNRRIDDTHVEVICCGKHITIYEDSELTLENDYQGFWRGTSEFPVFQRMPTLRRLKQRASEYQDEVWKKRKPSRQSTWHKQRIEEALHAPWTDRQVQLINDYQRWGQWAPENCRKSYEDGHKRVHQQYAKEHDLKMPGVMLATREGFVCPVCDERRTYADRHMLLGDFNPID